MWIKKKVKFLSVFFFNLLVTNLSLGKRKKQIGKKADRKEGKSNNESKKMFC